MPTRRTLLGVAAGSAALALVVLLDVKLGGPLSLADQLVAPWVRATVPPRVRYQVMQDVLSFPGNDLVVWSVVLVGSLALLARRRWRHALVMAAGGGLGILLTFTLKDLVARPRPGGASHSYAFPSGHAMNAAIAYGLLTLLLLDVLRPGPATRRLASGACALLVLVVGAARVLAGAHWPTDVVGGWALGAAWVALVLLPLSAPSRVRRASGA